MPQYYIAPVQDSRARRWERIYGRSQLPVKYPQPHLACTQRWGDIAVYYLDGTAVPPALLDRLATYESRRMGIPYAEARLNVRREWLIPAEGCYLEVSQAAGHTSWQPAFSFLGTVQLRAATL